MCFVFRYTVYTAHRFLFIFPWACVCVPILHTQVKPKSSVMRAFVCGRNISQFRRSLSITQYTCKMNVRLGIVHKERSRFLQFF